MYDQRNPDWVPTKHMGYTSLAKIAQSKGLERFKRLQERVKRVRYETGIILYAEILFLFKLARIAFFFCRA